MNQMQLEVARQLRKEGKTYEEIGTVLKVSRQRVHQILTGYRAPKSGKRKERAVA